MDLCMTSIGANVEIESDIVPLLGEVTATIDDMIPDQGGPMTDIQVLQDPEDDVHILLMCTMKTDLTAHNDIIHPLINGITRNSHII